MQSLSLIIPARNEQDRLPPTLDLYLPELRALGHPFEIRVVVNNSSDDTLAVCQRYAAKHPEIVVQEENDPGQIKGKGDAVRAGFREAINTNADLIGFVDADGATPPNAFLDLVHKLLGSPEAVGVIANRYHPDATILTYQPLRRRLASRAFNFAVRFLLKLKSRDTQCGAKIFRRAPLQAILADCEQPGWLFDIELLLLLQRQEGIVHEIPTTWQDVEGSRFSIGQNIGQVIRDLMALRKRFRK